MKINTKIIILALLINVFCLNANEAKYESENLNLYVSYNDEIIPGDAIFVKMIIQTPKNHKKIKFHNDKKAELTLSLNNKIIEKSPFYQINTSKKQNISELLSGIPLSSWLESGNFELKVFIELDEIGKKEFTLPVKFTSKIFNEEIINLDEKNTSIKTDTSPTRISQINKLNDILYTNICDDVYSLKSFISPTTSTRYTSFFGDRRTYKYTNGKSSTSLHYGNDYGIPDGSEVKACSSGKIVMAENRISTGFSIVIEHLPGLYSLYYHLSEMNVKEGDFVEQGALIGKSGSTGLATGPHLHWEVRLNGEAVRPEFFFADFAFEKTADNK